MDNQFKKLLLGAAVVAGLGAAYYFTKSKPVDQQAAVEAPQPSVESEIKEEPAKAEPQTQAAGDSKTQTSAEEPAPTDNKDTADLKPYTDESIAAVIKTINKEVTIADVKKTVELLPRQMREVPFETLYPILLRQSMDMFILEHNAKNAGFDKNPEVVRAIAERKNNIIVAAFLEQEVEKQVSDDVLRKKYDEMRKSIPQDEKEVEIAHVLV
ncbi:MAG: hypothetical protein Q8K36_00780, partial [Alphaproteobacteria bacterium]|nr:hypothetical protein [Alphaproteobacteria bacterium]